MKTKRLNAQQKLFIKHYLDTFNASKSAELAGYAKETGIRLMNNETVRTEINRSVNDLYKKHAIAEDDLIARLKAIAFEQNPAEKAIELLGRHLGMFKGVEDNAVGQMPTIKVVVNNGDELDDNNILNTYSSGVVQRSQH
jgi:phage terminase small subunit